MGEYIVLVSGNLASGKTTFIHNLSACLNWHSVVESVIDNPYLSDFYADMRSWAFHLQVYFLGCRVQQYLEACTQSQSCFVDRSVYEDAHVFAPALHSRGFISDRDYAAYMRVFKLLEQHLRMPDAVIYLHARHDVLLDRIRRRGLSCDSAINESYLGLIDDYYGRWVRSLTIPIVDFDTTEWDLQHTPQTLDRIVTTLFNVLQHVHL